MCNWNENRATADTIDSIFLVHSGVKLNIHDVTQYHIQKKGILDMLGLLISRVKGKFDNLFRKQMTF